MEVSEKDIKKRMEDIKEIFRKELTFNIKTIVIKDLPTYKISSNSENFFTKIEEYLLKEFYK